MVEVVVVGGGEGGGGVGRNLFEDPILRRGELFVPNLHNKMKLLKVTVDRVLPGGERSGPTE